MCCDRFSKVLKSAASRAAAVWARKVARSASLVALDSLRDSTRILYSAVLFRQDSSSASKSATLEAAALTSEIPPPLGSDDEEAEIPPPPVE